MLALALIELGSAFERQVDGFSRATGPNNVAGLCADKVGHMGAGLLYGLCRLLPPGMAARGRIAKMRPQPDQHGLHHTRVNRGGCAVI